MKQRLSNYELLRIVAILLISLMHGISSAYGSHFAVNSIAHVSTNAVGNMGVTLFVLISGYFGIRLRASKAWQLWSTMFFYSLLLFAAQCYLHEVPSPQEDGKEFLKLLYVALTPATSNTWWFCTSYLIVLLLSPFLNKICDSISQRQFQYLLAVLLAVYSLSPTFLMHSLSGSPNGKCTENMILVYFLGRYIALYGIPEVIRRHAALLFTSCFGLIFVVDYFVFDPLFLCKDHTLFIILGAVCVFHFFGKINITASWISDAIRYAAGFVFPFYLLNVFLIHHLEFQYAPLADSPWYLAHFLLVQVELLAVTFVVEWLRRLFMGRLVTKVSGLLDRRFAQ